MVKSVYRLLHLLSCYFRISEIFEKTEDTLWSTYENQRHDLRFYYTQWIFVMWIIMYVIQLCWTLYGLELICRKANSSNIYHSVPVVPSVVFLLTAIAEAAILFWLFLWTTSAYFRYAPLAMLASTVCFYVALALSVSSLSKNLHILYGIRAYRYVWETRILVHNGLGVAAAWTTVVLFYSVVVVLQANGLLPFRQDGYVFLSLLGGYLVVWFFVDISLARKYIPHLLSPYLVFIVAEVQVLLKSGLVFNYHFIYSVVLLVLTSVMTIVRISLAVGMATRK